jgi:hypothetical protein
LKQVITHSQPLYLNDKNVLGHFKDKAAGNIVTQLVGLRSKLVFLGF